MLGSVCMMMMMKKIGTRERRKKNETRRTNLPDRTSYVWNNVLNEYKRTGRHISTLIFIFYY
jgi:hypothetical protein